MFQIKDGSGQGYLCKVDDHNRLYVHSNTISHMSHHTTYHKNAYIAQFDLTAADTNEAPVFILYNADSVNEYEIYKVCMTTSGAGLVTLKVSNTYSSGGTAVTATNTYRGSGNVITPTCYEGGASDNLVLAGTAVDIMKNKMGANSTHTFDFEGGLVISNTHGFSGTFTGDAGSEVVSITVFFALHPTGAKL